MERQRDFDRSEPVREVETHTICEGTAWHEQSKRCSVKTCMASSASMMFRSVRAISHDCGRRTASSSITTPATRDIQMLTRQLRSLSKSFPTLSLQSGASFKH